MLATKSAPVLLGVALLALAAVRQCHGASGPKEDAPEPKSRAAVEAWVRRIMSSDSAKAAPVPVKPTIEPVGGDAVSNVLSKERYYAVHFPRYPRAVPTPAPLRQDNLVRVRPDGSVARIEDLDALKADFAKNLHPIRDEAQARAAALAFLPLVVEFFHHGRGRYTFEVPEEGVTVSQRGNQWTATGKATVTKGGEGQVTATLHFDASGKLKPSAIQISARLRALPEGRLR